MTFKPPDDPGWQTAFAYAAHKSELYARLFCGAHPATPHKDLRDWMETLIRDAFNLGRCYGYEECLNES